MVSISERFDKKNVKKSPNGSVSAKIANHADFLSTDDDIFRVFQRGLEHISATAWEPGYRTLNFAYKIGIAAGTYRLTNVQDPPAGMVYARYYADGKHLEVVPDGTPNSITFNTAGGERSISGHFEFNVAAADGQKRLITGDFNIVGFTEFK